MNIPLQIAFPDFPPSRAVSVKIRERVEKLEHFYSRITGCHVTVGHANRKHHKGNLYSVSIELSVPGEKIIYGRARHQDNAAHQDVYVALRDAFDAIERRLHDHTRKMRPAENLRGRMTPTYGRVVRLMLENPEGEGFGFLENEQGREIYFSSHSVLHQQFGRMRVGSRVRFAEESGEAGPQASTVELVAA